MMTYSRHIHRMVLVVLQMKLLRRKQQAYLFGCTLPRSAAVVVAPRVHYSMYAQPGPLPPFSVAGYRQLL
jgi:hypothetical protein